MAFTAVRGEIQNDSFLKALCGLGSKMFLLISLRFYCKHFTPIELLLMSHNNARKVELPTKSDVLIHAC